MDDACFFLQQGNARVEITTAGPAVYLANSIEMIKREGFAFRH